MKTTTKSTKANKTNTKTEKAEKAAKATKGYSKKGGPRGSIMGLPIENADHTVGEEGGKTPTPTKQTNKIKTPKAPAIYTGASIAATKVYKRNLGFKNCLAEQILCLNTETGTFTTMNLYNSILPASYKSETYTYQLDTKAQKKIDKKLADAELGFVEMEEISEWPSFLTAATRTMDLLPKNLQKKVAKLRKSTK